MSYNGSGTFVINSTGQPVVTGTVISSSTFNSLTADLGTGLSTAITKDGQTTTTAKIPFAQGLSAAVASNFAAGTVGAPSIYLSTDTTTGLYRIGANNDGFAVSGVKLLDLGSALVGITGALTVSTTLGVTGASTIAALSATSGTFSTTLAVTGTSTLAAVNASGDITYTLSQNSTDSIKVVNANAGASAISEMRVSNNTTALFMAASGTGYSGALLTTGVAGYHAIATFGSVGLSIGTNLTAAININSAQAVTIPGTLGVTGKSIFASGGTAAPAGLSYYSQAIWTDPAAAIYGIVIGQQAIAGGALIAFVSSNGIVGSITTAGSATTYATSSDYRLKENIKPMQNALATVAALKPVMFNWKVDGSDGQGFIAHELQAVLPDCVTGQKDATEMRSYEISAAAPATFDEEGNELTVAVEAVMGEREVPKYQGVDTSFLVATLTAAIQELTAKVAALEAK